MFFAHFLLRTASQANIARPFPCAICMLAVCLALDGAIRSEKIFGEFERRIPVCIQFRLLERKRVFCCRRRTQTATHTWSLAIEEQYYVLFPALIMVFWPLGLRWMISLFAIVATASLFAAEWGAIHFPAGAFYFLPTRGWELLIGAILAIFCFPARASGITAKNRMTGEIASVTGILLIAYAVFYFNQDMPFPSFYALIPTLGTALLIGFATAKTYTGQLLGSRVVAVVGLISYSTYLWHQPLLAFARLRNAEAPATALSALLTFAALSLGYVTWRYVEQPFRKQRRFSGKTLFAVCAAVSLAIFSIGMVGYIEDGFVNRWSSEERQILAYEQYPMEALYREGQCFLRFDQRWQEFSPICSAVSDEGNLLLWGDSHAASLQVAFEQSCQIWLFNTTPARARPLQIWIFQLDLTVETLTILL